MDFCGGNVLLCNRRGWRLPTVEELSSLIDPSQSDPALPSGHPFINVQYPENAYWSSTTYEKNSAHAWKASMRDGALYDQHKGSPTRGYVWPVRGGNGYGTGRW